MTSTLKPVSAYSAQPDVRGRGPIHALEVALQAPPRWLGAAIPDVWNPLLHTGVIANTTFAIALVSGILLLFWYVPSIHQAFDSVEAMAGAPLTAGLMRSLHRYSSDACILFAMVHGLQSIASKRFGGARWLAWVSGIAMVSLIWFLGWTGYWLVWDQRGQEVALGTAKIVDVLPIFADPLGRSFLTNDSVSSLLFFLVFFLHMILPLAMGVGIWFHVMRLSRTPYFTGRVLTAWILVTLVALSLWWPATTAPRADLQQIPAGYTMDYWYLLPIALADRLQVGALWAGLLVLGVALYSIPWTLMRARPGTAVVVESRCNACESCYHDCPYAAISMGPRTDGRDRVSRAIVDPSLCVGCGICNGSCDTAAIGLTWLPELDQRHTLDRYLQEAQLTGDPTWVAFVCAESAASRLQIDPATGRSVDLPGYRVLPTPCAGWVLALDVERALRRGAQGVLVASCLPGSCAYREGVQWTHDRLFGDREPALRRSRVDMARVRQVTVDRSEYDRFVREAAAFREGSGGSAGDARTAWRTWGGGVAAALVLAAVTYLPSDLWYGGTTHRAPTLVVSFKHPGRQEQHCRTLSPEELAKLPPHMRGREECERGRASVRMRVRVDGTGVLDKRYPPGGLFGDGASLAMERLPLTPGSHRVEVDIGDSRDPDEWSFHDGQTVAAEPGRTRVVLFDRTQGFTWH